ncbi:hypothetical protein [Deinococcus ruber]|uniref:Uncharacterized protein n=1 Tax=Deinococcus ruber TaxID=1848197 RepID=A0A918CMY4_9DEIO|nr:hypothetical protein [Deinococcus ruber]GGR29393.1 hypothetical protein GCM10008957_45530 [Deinococcus ruber]
MRTLPDRPITHRLTRQPITRLEHLAGSAEMRQQMGAPADPKRWKVEHPLYQGADGVLAHAPDE